MNRRNAKPEKTEKWGRIAVALVTGLCIIALALVSKRVLDESIRPLFLAIPPLLMFAYELVAHRHAEHTLARPGFWIIAIAASTILIALLHMA